MKKKVVMIICMVVMLITAMPVYAVSFSDINGHWAHDNIIKLTEKGVINGYEDGTFRPENMVTYGEFMKLVVCSYVPEEKIIKKIEGLHWSKRYVITAEMYGFFSVGTVRDEKLDTPISRIEMVKILAKIDSNMNGQTYIKTKEIDFIDVSDLPNEYLNYLDRVINKGYILGNPDQTFKPDDTLTRAEVVTILTRL